ncbi:MAG: hypothetical protein ABGY43_03820 [bacterium]
MIATHYKVDLTEHYPAEYIEQRDGNTRLRGNEGLFLLEHVLTGIVERARWRQQQGI